MRQLNAREGLKATNGRDKVYGLSGLLTCRDVTLVPNKLLEIDYRLPIRTVYYRAAQWSILEHNDLRICHCQTFTPKRVAGLPSWRPDWSTLSDGSPVMALRPHNCIDNGVRGKISFASHIMCVSGCFVDTIDYMTAQRLTCKDPLPDIQSILRRRFGEVMQSYHVIADVGVPRLLDDGLVLVREQRDRIGIHEVAWLEEGPVQRAEVQSLFNVGLDVVLHQHSALREHQRGEDEVLEDAALALTFRHRRVDEVETDFSLARVQARQHGVDCGGSGEQRLARGETRDVGLYHLGVGILLLELAGGRFCVRRQAEFEPTFVVEHGDQVGALFAARACDDEDLFRHLA